MQYFIRAYKDKYTFFYHFLLFLFASGAVIANRLSEIEDWNILLLEAGGDEPEISDVPLFAGYLQLSQLDWQYKTEPHGDSCLGIMIFPLFLHHPFFMFKTFKQCLGFSLSYFFFTLLNICSNGEWPLQLASR